MRSVHREVQQAIVAVERSVSPGAGAGFAARAAAIEALETHVLDRLRYLEDGGRLPVELQELATEAVALRERLEAANEQVLRRLRCLISSGRSTPGRLMRSLARHAGPPGRPGDYDTLDLLVGGLLGGDAPEEPRVEREPEMVGYQPTPARAILALIERTHLRPEDVVYDLGSGLGHVVILVALLGGARAVGIELEPAYSEYAQACARRLNVPGVEFILGDAREAPLAGGTVYFLYTPFRRSMLQQVLGRLQAEARERPIRVCTLGPCTAEVVGTRWLRPLESSGFGEHEVCVFESVPPDSSG